MAVYHSTQILCKWTHALIITVSVRIMHSYNVRFIHTVSAYAALWGGVFKNTQHYVTVLSESTEMAQIALQTTQHGEEASSSVATQNTFSLCGSDAKWLLTLKENLMMLPVLNCFQNKYWSINLWLLANVTEHLIALPLGGLYLYLLAVEIWFDIVQSEFIEIGCSAVARTWVKQRGRTANVLSAPTEVWAVLSNQNKIMKESHQRSVTRSTD